MKERPDLIVSDVMMLRMTGTEMCMHIKNNIDLSHISVVLLTALDSIEQNIEGLRQIGHRCRIKRLKRAAILLRERRELQIVEIAEQLNRQIIRKIFNFSNVQQQSVSGLSIISLNPFASNSIFTFPVSRYYHISSK